MTEKERRQKAKDIALKIQENMPSTCKLLLHKINYYYDEGTKINYELKNILEA